MRPTLNGPALIRAGYVVIDPSQYGGRVLRDPSGRLHMPDIHLLIDLHVYSAAEIVEALESV